LVKADDRRHLSAASTKLIKRKLELEDLHKSIHDDRLKVFAEKLNETVRLLYDGDDAKDELIAKDHSGVSGSNNTIDRPPCLFIPLPSS
jgi:hypothetical protein